MPIYHIMIKSILLSVFLFSGILVSGEKQQVMAYKTGPAFLFTYRARTFVDKTEKVCGSYSGADWIESQKHFGKLIGEYSEFYSSLNKKKKDKVNKAIGKYLGLTFRAGIRISFDLLKEIYRKAPSVLEEAYKKK